MAVFVSAGFEKKFFFFTSTGNHFYMTSSLWSNPTAQLFSLSVLTGSLVNFGRSLIKFIFRDLLIHHSLSKDQWMPRVECSVFTQLFCHPFAPKDCTPLYYTSEFISDG